MNGLSPKELKQAAKQRLQDAPYSPKKLILWYSGITLGLNLLAVLVSWLTAVMVENTGGLSGLGTRAIWETVNMVFSYAVQIATPLLSFGFLFCCIRLERQQDLHPKMLTVGLRRWGVILRMGLLTGILMLMIGYLSLLIASIIFAFFPGAPAAVKLVLDMMNDPAALEGNLTDQQLWQMVKAFAPAYMIGGILFIIAYLPIYYRLRLAELRIMEEHPVGAIKAMLQSNRLMKRNCISLFKLDLSFWWYYLLTFLLSSAVVAVQFLPNITLPIYALIYAGYALLLLAIQYLCLAKVQTTYCVFYSKAMENTQKRTLPQLPQQ